MALNRDNFTAKTVDILAKRVGYLCSNPNCRKATVGPNTAKDKATIVGVAAHITAASSGGPRYDGTLTTEQRKDIDNGIWLCVNCSTVIDKDPNAFPIAMLNEWKEFSENEMNKELLGIELKRERPFIEADLIWSNSQRWNKGYSYKNKELYGNVIVLGENKPIIIWNLVWNFKIALYNNSRFPAFNVKIEQVAGTNFSSIDSLSKINNLPPYADLELRASFEDYLEGTHLEADELIKPKVPEIIQGLQMKLTYNDENGTEHATIFTINGDEFNNERA
ncbi:hypothetical protein [Zobellia nedashkovskayae]|uniref:hypothetical protein n=1 Tax=Zobellia nedashkovskayae TaxID=2779510 RepID=UPI00188C8C90|nr:hypothetical protein [Zobellia nedashkovskayae]